MKQRTRERAKTFAKALNFAASAALVLGMAPTAALAEAVQGGKVVSETPIAGLTADQIKAGFKASPAHVVKTADGYDVIDDATDEIPSGATTLAALPEKFDLRDADLDGDGVNENYVTRVKNQGAFGTCWAFGSTSAAEASLVSELGLGTPAGTTNDNLDLSEKHLAWFTYQTLPDDEALNTAYHQAGEGMTARDTSKYPDSGYVYNPGGAIAYGTTMYSGLMGPTLESDFPYQNAEGTYATPVDHADDHSYDVPNPNGDWSLPAEDRFAPSYAELEQSFYLPSPAQWDATDDPAVKEYRYSQEAVDLIKEQVVNGRGVGIAYHADTALAGQETDDSFINRDTWAHYTNVSHNMGGEYQGVAATHAVCIVGFDDTYPKENFLADKQPPADGAFIVKNSWGASDNDRPNKGDWGVDGTGYFYLSYYDRSIENPESFDFVTRYDDDLQYGKEAGYQVGRYLYDFLPSKATTKNTYGDGTEVTSQGNIFNVLGPAVIRTLSTKTDSFDTTVTYDLYRLNDGAATPTDGELVWSKEVTYPTGGYHRVELDEPVLVTNQDGERFGVVVTTKLSDGTYETMNHTAFSKTFSDLVYASTIGQSKVAYGAAVVNEGESFIGSPQSEVTLEDGTTTNGNYTWVDLSDIIEAKQGEAKQALDEAGVTDLIAAGVEGADKLEALNAQYTKDDGSIDVDNPDYQAAQEEIASQTMGAVYGLGAYMDTISTDELQDNFAFQAVDNNPIGLTAEPGWDDVYRLYNPNNGEHFYTIDLNEVATLLDEGWEPESDQAWQAPDKLFADGPIYRLFNPYTLEHLYTMDRNEYDTLTAAGWNGEDVKLYSLGSDGMPVYRLYNPYNPGPGEHMYTTDRNEYDSLVAAGWNGEDVAFYGWN